MTNSATLGFPGWLSFVANEILRTDAQTPREHPAALEAIEE
jgi:hypothetical protein